MPFWSFWKPEEWEILDWENPDARLTHVEYHRADGIRGGRVVEGAGDKSDNLYCFFE